MADGKVKGFYIKKLAIFLFFCYTGGESGGITVKRLFGLFLAAALLLSGCSGRELEAEAELFAMDTYMYFRVWGRDAQEGLSRTEALIREMERDWSPSEEDSIPSRLSRGEDADRDEEAQAFLQAVEALSRQTGGAFDPHMGAVSAAWGFRDGNYRVPTAEELARARAMETLDVGGALKGYAGQRAAEALEALDIDRAVLNLGGNVQTFGEKPDGEPWRIAIQDPWGGDGQAGVLEVTGTASVVTAGSYQRYFEQGGKRYHHILDPETLCPAESGLAAVTVVCADGLKADVYSTALFVMGLERGAEFWRENRDFEAVFLLENGKVYATEGAALSGCVFEVIGG